MKKQYDTKRLTDELSRSVFFQDPKQPDKLTPEQNQVQETRPQPALATKQQSRLATKQQADTSVRQQNEKAASNQCDLSGKQQSSEPLSIQPALSASNQSNKAGSSQTNKVTHQQSNKALKRFTSYLQEPTLKALRVLAAQQDKKDYEVLQEAVEQYLAREQANT